MPIHAVSSYLFKCVFCVASEIFICLPMFFWVNFNKCCIWYLTQEITKGTYVCVLFGFVIRSTKQRSIEIILRCKYVEINAEVKRNCNESTGKQQNFDCKKSSSPENSILNAMHLRIFVSSIFIGLLASTHSLLKRICSFLYTKRIIDIQHYSKATSSTMPHSMGISK